MQTVGLIHTLEQCLNRMQTVGLIHTLEQCLNRMQTVGLIHTLEQCLNRMQTVGLIHTLEQCLNRMQTVGLIHILNPFSWNDHEKLWPSYCRDTLTGHTDPHSGSSAASLVRSHALLTLQGPGRAEPDYRPNGATLLPSVGSVV
ncbi:hypothetical protein AAFF_G00199720 [Aldrovandia affinis]|uniref:Uncharacterized protein n=1 Tax=Aldrovandia affinis TaxID=143900 RepID=A0AAD7RID8_9TELE|nr:hypothetical protein AAFF_G00199720 [Aldrovandia affinis]